MSSVGTIKRPTSTGRVVEGVGGDESAAVQRARHHELDLADPLLHCLRFRLGLLRIRLEVVREVAVQVVPSGIMSGEQLKT